MKRKRKYIVIFIILPFLLLLSTSVVFYFSSQLLGSDLGYVIGFIFYWLFWCLLIPYLFSRKNFLILLKDKKKLFIKQNWWIIILLLLTIIAPVFMYFIPNINKLPIMFILISIPIALFNGLCEELLWRGLYISFFPGDIVLCLIVPTIGFSLWHLAPQIVFPAGSGPIIFVLLTLPLGITYGLVAYVTQSAKWSAIAHGLSGILAFGLQLTKCVYNLISGN